MRFQLKAFTSLLLALFFVALTFSGAILYVTPRGRMANWAGWSLLGLEKDQWQALHITVAIVFLVAGAVHLFYNWGMFWGYLKKLKWEMAAALGAAAVVLVVSVKQLPPVSQLMTLNAQIKDYWEREPITAPIPHAEELTVGQLAANMGLSTEQVLQALKQEGITVENEGLKIAELAAKNGLAPSDVHAAISKHFPQERRPGQGQGKGFGRGRGGQGRGWGKISPE